MSFPVFARVRCTQYSLRVIITVILKARGQELLHLDWSDFKKDCSSLSTIPQNPKKRREQGTEFKAERKNHGKLRFIMDEIANFINVEPWLCTDLSSFCHSDTAEPPW